MTNDPEKPLQPLANLLSAMADVSRLRILVALREKETLYLMEVISLLGLSHGAAQHHLSVLEKVGLIQKIKSGRFVSYVLDEGTVIKVGSELGYLFELKGFEDGTENID
jgi:DNA-binding transcriptional ArsR family regulator